MNYNNFLHKSNSLKYSKVKSIEQVIEELSSELGKILRSDGILMDANHQIIFVFGKHIKEENSLRGKFIQYANKHLHTHKFLLAEKFFETYTDKKNLLDIEDKLAHYTDCIILFLESPGSIAELGAFALKENLLKKLLVINDIRFKKQISFINLGPIDKVNTSSRFKPTIFLDYNKFLFKVNEIESRLIQGLSNKSKRLKSEDFHRQNNDKNILLLIADIIQLFQPISKDQIDKSIKSILRPYPSESEIRFNLAFLESLDYVCLFKFKDKHWYYKHPGSNVFHFKIKDENFLYNLRIKYFSIVQKKERKLIEVYCDEIKKLNL